tara:strand:- start:5513 stop:6199 length:687 start_codon:yes stop_codon:yes gene_type:complete
MKKLILILSIIIGIGVNLNAQIQSLAGPRLGFAFITKSPTSGFINGELKIGELGELPQNYEDIVNGGITSLYGWQFESRFADGQDVTGIVEWILLAGGMERGKFLPSISSMVGARTSNGLEFAMGPNLSLGGIAMVFGIGYNFVAGDLNMPVNFAFVPGKKATYTEEGIAYTDQVLVNNPAGPDGQYGTADDVSPIYEDQLVIVEQGYEIDYHTGNRFSITVGFNMNK